MKNDKDLRFSGRLPLNDVQREQAKRGMEIIDITKGTPVPSAEKGNEATSPSEDYLAAERFVREITSPALREIGIKRAMKNFSQDYPINVLGDSNRTFFSELAAKTLGNKAAAHVFADAFFTLFGEEYDALLEARAAKMGKTPDDLTDDEHEKAAHEFAVQKGIQVFSELFRAQKAKEIFEVARGASAFEDFSTKHRENNLDLVDYLRSYYHSRASYGGTVSIEDIDQATPNQMLGKSIDDEICLISGLSEEEKTLIDLKLEGYNQAEIAKKLGYKGQGTVSKKLAQLKKKLEEQLK